MIVENPSQYRFITFGRSNTANKKYDAILQHKETKRFKKVPFGDSRYQHFRDNTGLHLYSHMDHQDLKRRDLYYARHGTRRSAPRFSSKWFSHHYLW